MFEITKSRLSEALERHPSLVDRVSITVAKDGENFAQNMRKADAMFAWDFDKVNLSSTAPNLKWIHLQGAGINHLLPLDWVPPQVTLTNSRGAHGKRASEYLIMSILALNNGLPKMVHNQAKSTWEKIHNSTIAGKTLLIYGVGHVGGDTAESAKHFGMQVLGVRRSGAAHPFVDRMYQSEQLHELIPRADFIVVSAPHTAQTENVFGPKEFALMKVGAGFINYSRAQLVDYDALEAALYSNKISAIVDVFNQEPLPEKSSLWGTPNLIITPHSSSNDPINHANRSLDILFDNVSRFVDGHTLNNIIDLDHGY